MFFPTIAAARNRLLYRKLRKQISKDVASGHTSAEEAAELLERLPLCDGYVDMSVGVTAAKLLLNCSLLANGTKFAAANLLIEYQTAADPRISPRVVHAPGLSLIRLIPWLTSGFGIIAIARVEPRLWDVILRYCEAEYERLHLGFLNPVWTRPLMCVFGRLARLDWSDLRPSHA